METKFQNIELAFDYVSSAQRFMNTAYISKSTGKIYYQSEMYDSDELPEDIDVTDDYIEIPHKNDLDLGQHLVWQFVDIEIPDQNDKIRGFFSRRGAYSNYKSFLEEIGLLEKWYKFENNKTKEVLQEWCKNNRIEIAG
ncbi:MAG: hypothetical protein GY699_11190 [Desulfobacteraceae bacterium]|nr:hypothetical protein [Desulfobacteraceae bacterium]